MNDIFGIIGIGGIIGAVLAIAILAMISHNEKRAIERFNAELEQSHENRMKKLDEILLLIDNIDSTMDRIETKLEK